MTFNHLWIEKYRPKTIDDVVLPQLDKLKIKQYLKDEMIPHMAFYGPPGTGKSTTARIIVENLIKDSGDFIKINGSLSGRIDAIRNTIIPFTKTPPVASKLKIVYFEEFDNTSFDAQMALKDVIESSSKFVSFILTFNYENKVLNAIKSRVQMFKVTSPPIHDVIERCKFILEQENISYNIADITRLVSRLYPQIRDIVKTLQLCSVNGQFIYDESKVTNEFDELYKQVKKLLTSLNNSYREDRKLISSIVRYIHGIFVDFPSVIKEIAKDEELPIELRLEASGYVDKIAASLSPQLAFMNCIWNLLKLKHSLIKQGLLTEE